MQPDVAAGHQSLQLRGRCSPALHSRHTGGGGQAPSFGEANDGLVDPGRQPEVVGAENERRRRAPLSRISAAGQAGARGCVTGSLVSFGW